MDTEGLIDNDGLLSGEDDGAEVVLSKKLSSRGDRVASWDNSLEGTCVGR